jgi:hypothetical protein
MSRAIENRSNGGIMETVEQDRGAGEPEGTPPSVEPAWEQIENGRYRPRRIRGSCPGRELG